MNYTTPLDTLNVGVAVYETAKLRLILDYDITDFLEILYNCCFLIGKS